MQNDTNLFYIGRYFIKEIDKARNHKSLADYVCFCLQNSYVIEQQTDLVR